MINDADLAGLEDLLGADGVSVRPGDLEAHAADESWIDAHLPDVVVWPTDTEQVAAVVRYAAERRLPVSPWSGGSSLEGNPVPVHGGIVLAMYRLNRILEIREDDLQVVVQPGVIYDELNQALRRLGMFFPPAPGSSDVATIGGMVANNSSGMRAVKYGVTRDYVQQLEVVLPSGEVVRLGSRAKKSTSGYDLVGLFVGSEGTLGVVTEATLRLVGLPECVGVSVAAFAEQEAAATAVYESVRYGLGPSAIELLDAHTVRATNQQQGLDLQELPTLFCEFHGSEAAVAEQMSYLREVCEDNGCVSFEDAITPEEAERLWVARREAHDSIKLSHPGKTMISGDVCVPISRFGETLAYAQRMSAEHQVLIYAFGHAGDGNLHTETIADKADADEFARGLRATDAIVAFALDVGGTIAGEHGVGVGKRQFMQREHGPSLELMRGVKRLLDPLGIMNPGKVLPDA